MKQDLKEMPAVMTAREVAAYLRFSKEWGHQTVMKMARQGKIKGEQFGDLWRFSREVVEALMAGRKTK